MSVYVHPAVYQFSYNKAGLWCRGRAILTVSAADYALSFAQICLMECVDGVGEQGENEEEQRGGHGTN